jgi:beta-lactamase class A
MPKTDSRRDFLRTAAGSVALGALPLGASEETPAGRVEDIPDLFAGLPGDTAFKIFAPAARGRRPILVQANSGKMLFVASAIKTFVLCEALRQVDAHDVVEKLEAKELVLDSRVWSFSSPTFNQPHLSGLVSERTTLEAMITRSDNTATDMMFKLAGAANVRRFIAAAGLRRTLVPDSTRAFSGYLFGAEDYLTLPGNVCRRWSRERSSIPFSTMWRLSHPRPMTSSRTTHERSKALSSNTPRR